MYLNNVKFNLFGFLLIFIVIKLNNCNEDAKRLYDDLMVNYNRNTRPAKSPFEPLIVHVKLRLSQIIDVHELDQIMTCSIWLKQSWIDNKLSWRPESYGGVRVLYVPYEMIWVPDIVLLNNADSNYNITINTKATLHHTGDVIWEPPAIFKSMCKMDITWFPFDEQSCNLEFGSWTYPETLLKLEMEFENADSIVTKKVENKKGNHEVVSVMKEGIDLSDYYPSVEWDIMSREAKQFAKHYPGGKVGAYTVLHYYLSLRRKPLFYTVNLVTPCLGISFMTILTFYLPSDSGEKVSFCINILVALTMFFLLLAEIIPANSISVPFVGKYLIFTMILVSVCVLTTVITLQLHFRKPTTHTMSNWIKKVFLKILPNMLFMPRPFDTQNPFQKMTVKSDKIFLNYHKHSVKTADNRIAKERLHKIYSSPSFQKSFKNLCFIAELLKKKERDIRVDEDWKYVAMVLDRLFLIIFSIVCFVGSGWILLQAPTFYDNRQPVDLQYRPPELN